MTKHNYSGWNILKTDNGYIAERQSDFHIAPETYRLLRWAKEAIDSGEANLTSIELKTREYKNELKHGFVKRELLEQRWWKLGDKAALLALEETEKR